MPAAIVRRIRFTETFQPVSEYLRREEALLAEVEWSWVADREQAHRFPSCEQASQAGLEHRGCDAAGALYDCFPIVCDDPARRERRARHLHDRLMDSLAGAEPVRRVSPAEAYARLEQRHLD